MASNESLLRVFSYLNAEKSELYRLIMLFFIEEQSRFAIHFREEEIFQAIQSKHVGFTDLIAIQSALSQLYEWGNLDRQQDTSNVRTVKEFMNRRFFYQLTREGEEAERSLKAYLKAVLSKGELQISALSDIQRLLLELNSILLKSPLDQEKTYEVLSRIKSRFEELTYRAQTFMSSLQRSIDLRGEDAESDLLHFKEILIDYLQRFIHELQTSSGEIRGIIESIEQNEMATLWKKMAAQELIDSIEFNPDEHERISTEWSLRWKGLRSWFIEDEFNSARSEILRRKALSAIPKLLGAILRLNERRVIRTDRVADLRTLARWFAESESEADAHRLWVAAFGLAPSRHLSLDPKTAREWEAHPVRPQTSWLNACAVTITPRLRTTGSYSRRGFAGSKLIDRTKEKAYLKEQAQEEARTLRLSKKELTRYGKTRLSSLEKLTPTGFELLLTLLSDALTHQKDQTEEIDATSSDGTLIVRMKRIPGHESAEILTELGTLKGPDYFIEIIDTEEVER